MIDDSMLPELAHYREFERKLPLTEPENFQDLVVSTSNRSQPIHRWYHFKEAYSGDLLGTLLAGMPDLPERIVLGDCFVGSGTSIISAQLFEQPRIDSIGVERNPFIHFVASTKASWPRVDPQNLEDAASKLSKKIGKELGELPSLSSISNGRCISKRIAQQLTALRDEIRSLPSPYRQVLLLGMASVIEKVSKTRKDGRALRLVTRRPANLKAAVEARWKEYVEDLTRLRPPHQLNSSRVFCGDGRSFTRYSGTNSLDIVFTSPPYPNNIDYTEVYKLELWLLGFISDEEAFLRLRKTTFKSHQTSFEEKELDASQLLQGDYGKLFGVLHNRVKMHQEGWRLRLIIGYFLDMKKTLLEIKSALKRGGKAFIVVGNSLFGNSEFAYLVTTDLLTAAMGESCGLTLEKILISRNMKRRLSGNHFLRESIVVFRKD